MSAVGRECPFADAVSPLEVPAEGPLVTNQSDIGVAAALQGLGILYAFDRERVDEVWHKDS